MPSSHQTEDGREEHERGNENDLKEAKRSLEEMRETIAPFSTDEDKIRTSSKKNQWVQSASLSKK